MTVTTILLYIILALTSLAVYCLKKRLSYWKEQGIAHNKPSLLWGNFQGLQTERSMATCIRETYEKFKGTGPFCGFYFFQRTSVVVLDLALAKNILIKDFANFTNRGTYHNEKDDPLMGHLGILDGVKWKSLRQKLSPTFTVGKMKSMYPWIVQTAEKFVKVLEDCSSENGIMEITDLLARFTTDIIGNCAFGIDCNCLRDPNAPFRLMGKNIIIKRRHGRFISGLVQGFPDLAKRFHMKVIADDITEFFLRIVRETVAYRETNNVEANDFLNILIELKNGKCGGDGGEQSFKLNIEEMAAQSFIFFLAGFETSSSTMGFALYELAQHQEIQEKLRQEINEAFDDSTGHINFEALQSLNYMGQVISETLRKYTIVPHLNRAALADYVVPGHPKYVIKKDMLAIIPSYGIHHDSDLYPQPEMFKPERFSPANIKQRDTIEFLAFGDGPRNCVGMRFGLLQTRIGLAYLLRNFKFSVCNRTEIPLEWNKKLFLLASKNGIYLKVEKV